MSKDRPLPEPNRLPVNLDEMGVWPVECLYEVASWCPERDGKGPATQVHLALVLKVDDKLTLRPTIRLKSVRAVNELIGVLERHRDDVWPGGQS